MPWKDWGWGGGEDPRSHRCIANTGGRRWTPGLRCACRSQPPSSAHRPRGHFPHQRAGLVPLTLLEPCGLPCCPRPSCRPRAAGLRRPHHSDLRCPWGHKARRWPCFPVQVLGGLNEGGTALPVPSAEEPCGKATPAAMPSRRQGLPPQPARFSSERTQRQQAGRGRTLAARRREGEFLGTFCLTLVPSPPCTEAAKPALPGSWQSRAWGGVLERSRLAVTRWGWPVPAHTAPVGPMLAWTGQESRWPSAGPRRASPGRPQRHSR